MLRIMLLCLLVSPAFAQTYDFTLYAAGIGVGGGWDGSFNYLSGAITDFTFQGEQWATQPTQGNDLAFMDSAGQLLTTTLYTPLGGQSTTASYFVMSFDGGYNGWCGGSADCNGPIVFTAENQVAPLSLSVNAPEMDPKSMASALTLLLGGLAVIRGRGTRTPV